MVQLPSEKQFTQNAESVIRLRTDPQDGTLTWRKAIDRLCESYRKVNERYDSRILIVDADREASIGLADFLHDLDYRVDVAHSGQDALGHVRRKTYHLVVMEMHLPDMDGIELFDHVRKTRKSPQFQAVILTSAALDSETTRIAQTRGLQGVLSKPVNLVELLRFIQQLRDKSIAN